MWLDLVLNFVYKSRSSDVEIWRWPALLLIPAGSCHLKTFLLKALLRIFINVRVLKVLMGMYSLTTPQRKTIFLATVYAITTIIKFNIKRT